MPGRRYQLDDCVFQSSLNSAILKCQVVEMCCFVRLIFRFWFLVRARQRSPHKMIIVLPKGPKSTIQSTYFFSVRSHLNLSGFFHVNNMNLGAHSLLLTFLANFKHYFLKRSPIFDDYIYYLQII